MNGVSVPPSRNTLICSAVRSVFHPAGKFEEDVCAVLVASDAVVKLFAYDEAMCCMATDCDIALDIACDDTMTEKLDDEPETSGVGVVTCVQAASRRIVESAMREVVRIEEEYNKKSAAAATLFL